MRIALLVPNFVGYSGDARVVKSQAKELLQEGNEVSIFALSSNMEPPTGANIFLLGMPDNLLLQRVYRLIFPLDLFRVLRWTKELKSYDKIIAHLYPMTWLAYLAKNVYDIEYIFWFHGIEDPNLFVHSYERLYMNLHIFATKHSIKNADKVVSVSKFAKLILRELTGMDSEVIYNKVDAKIFRKGLDGSNIRKNYNIKYNDSIILSVGRIAPQKGFHLLIRSFNIVKEKIPNAKLVIVGEATFDYYFKELKEMSDSSVIFAGEISGDEMPFFYAMSDIYATCSLWETFNLPISEAQLCGKHVVAFDIEASREVIDQNGVLVKKGDINMFANACIYKLSEIKEYEL